MILPELNVLGKPYKIYAEYLEHGAIRQFVNVMKSDSIVQGALMPDAHQGYTLPIGGVVAAKDMIFPAMVGYDIGCGMCAIPTSFAMDEVKLYGDLIYSHIYDVIPVGPNHHQQNQRWDEESKIPRTDVMQKIYDGNGGVKGGLRQLGTLGGGRMIASSPRSININ